MENKEIIKNIKQIKIDINKLSEDIFLLQNNMKHSGFVFNNKVFYEHKDKSVNRLTRILKYAYNVVNISNEEGY